MKDEAYKKLLDKAKKSKQIPLEAPVITSRGRKINQEIVDELHKHIDDAKGDITITELAPLMGRSDSAVYSLVAKYAPSVNLKWKRESFAAPKAKGDKSGNPYFPESEKIPGKIYWGDSADHVYFHT